MLVKTLQCSCWELPMLLPVAPHLLCVSKPNKFIGSPVGAVVGSYLLCHQNLKRWSQLDIITSPPQERNSQNTQKGETKREFCALVKFSSSACCEVWFLPTMMLWFVHQSINLGKSLFKIFKRYSDLKKCQMSTQCCFVFVFVAVLLFFSEMFSFILSKFQIHYTVEDDFELLVLLNSRIVDLHHRTRFMQCWGQIQDFKHCVALQQPLTPISCWLHSAHSTCHLH